MRAAPMPPVHGVLAAKGVAYVSLNLLDDGLAVLVDELLAS